MTEGDKYLNVKGCPFCEMWLNGHFPEKVYFLSERFVITEYDGENVVIFREHVTEINKTDWGRILQKCRELFGWGMRLHILRHRYFPKDHWFAVIRSGRKPY